MAWTVDAAITTAWSVIPSAGDGWQTIPLVEILTEDSLFLLAENGDVLFTERTSIPSLWTAEVPP